MPWFYSSILLPNPERTLSQPCKVWNLVPNTLCITFQICRNINKSTLGLLVLNWHWSKDCRFIFSYQDQNFTFRVLYLIYGVVEIVKLIRPLEFLLLVVSLELRWNSSSFKMVLLGTESDTDTMITTVSWRPRDYNAIYSNRARTRDG